MDVKNCHVCKQDKPLTDFYASSFHSQGRCGRCKDCERNRSEERKAYAKAARSTEEGKRRLRNNTLRSAYSITLEQYDAMLLAQGGRCANPGCRTDVPGGTGRFHVDHDHACCPGDKSCGRCVRALLCAGCNLGLGNFKDNAARLAGAVEYLSRYGIIGNGN